MASLRTVVTRTVADRQDGTVIPAWVLTQERQERAERQQLAASTILGSALEPEVATS